MCPFCLFKLNDWNYYTYTIYVCCNNNCMVDDMHRYKIYYWNYPTKLMYRAFMIGQYYIEIDYDSQSTKISTLYSIILRDSIIIPYALKINLKNLSLILSKIKILLLFS